MKVTDIPYQSAEKWPEQTAIIDKSGSLSYADLAENIARSTKHLKGLGIKSGHGVGVMADNGREFVISAFAALGCGATVMPVWRQMKNAELLEMFNDAPIQAIIHDSRDAHRFDESSADVPIPGAGTMKLSWTNNEAGAAFASFVDDPAFVRFTSGTTGKSKGVVLSHKGVIERTYASNRLIGLNNTDKIIWVLPMAFHFFVSIVLYLRYGCTIIVCQDHLAETILDAANDHQATVLYASPMHIRMLTADKSGRGFPNLRYAISTSSGLPQPLFQTFHERFGIPVSQAYGIIEIGLPLINLAAPVERPDSVGKPQPDYDVAILDDNCCEVPRGEIGHLAFRGPGLFSGYLDPPRLSSEVLKNGWFFTGDMASVDHENFVSVKGRCNAMINVAGNKVFPEEVESVLLQHSAVAKAHVFGRTHYMMGEAVFAEVSLYDKYETIPEHELITFCRDRLSFFKTPQKIFFTTDIDETASGKIKRNV
ncbi:MAG: acyl--CoA ligase [Desulfobacterales bacterium]|nr:acyl--CoA ligase [Desulfobacterales bacterium]